jgi:3-hydroxyacyl-CoA dehydrogenase
MAMVDRKVASVPDIDVSMQLGAGHPMGPLHLADYVGLDTCLSILNGWVQAFPDDKAFFIPEVLKQKVAKGEFGRKSGKGFYTWNGDNVVAPVLE